MSAFKVLETQFQMFIKSCIYLDDEYVIMNTNYFSITLKNQLAIPEFCDTLIQHMESVKKLIDERAKHKEEYNSWVNERQMQTTEDKVDLSKALDPSLVDIESSGTALKEQYTSSRIRQQHTEQPEFNNKGEADQNAEQCHDICPLPATLTDNLTTELSNQSLESKNIRLKKTVAQFQKDFSRMEAHCVNLELKYQNQVLKEGQHGQFSKVKNNEAKPTQENGFAIAALKNELRKLTGNSVNTKFAKSSILGKPVLQPRRNQSVVRQPIAFKSERPRILKQRFVSQVDVNNNLSKPVTTHYFPKERESVVAKPHHMIAPGSSRYSLNDMVYNYYLEEAKKKTRKALNTEIHDHSNEPSSSKLVPKVVPPADKTTTSRQELELLFHHHITMLRNPVKEKFFESTDSYKDGDASFQLKSDSLPHAHAQTTKTYYKHQDSRIMKAQELKTKTSVQTLIYKIFLQRYQVYQGILLASFQDDAKYEHVGQDTRSQGGKDVQDGM
ncbi:hypothetical protein Tco_0604729 [Tanacetum coccineum]